MDSTEAPDGVSVIGGNKKTIREMNNGPYVSSHISPRVQGCPCRNLSCLQCCLLFLHTCINKKHTFSQDY